jgi:ATP-dependent exoDNAse (exonuclease V) alpha subunit
MCAYDQDSKLPVSKLLVDECSMMDLPLAAALLNAIE